MKSSFALFILLFILIVGVISYQIGVSEGLKIGLAFIGIVFFGASIIIGRLFLLTLAALSLLSAYMIP